MSRNLLPLKGGVNQILGGFLFHPGTFLDLSKGQDTPESLLVDVFCQDPVHVSQEP